MLTVINEKYAKCLSIFVHVMRAYHFLLSRKMAFSRSSICLKYVKYDSNAFVSR